MEVLKMAERSATDSEDLFLDSETRGLRPLRLRGLRGVVLWFAAVVRDGSKILLWELDVFKVLFEKIFFEIKIFFSKKNFFFQKKIFFPKVIFLSISMIFIMVFGFKKSL